MEAHAAVAALNLPKETVEAVLADWKTAPVPERTRAALSLLECMTLRPMELDAAFVAELRAAGLDDLALREAASVGFHYNWINRVADAFDFPIPTGRAKRRLARMLNLVGKLVKGRYAREPWRTGADGRCRPTEVELQRELLLTCRARTEPSLRQAVEAFVTAQWGLSRVGQPGLPEIQGALEIYLRKLARVAYQIVDRDVEALRESGLKDVEIFELTLVGSMGVGLVGLEQLFDVLHGSAQPLAG